MFTWLISHARKEIFLNFSISPMKAVVSTVGAWRLASLPSFSPVLFHLLPDGKGLPNSFSAMTILKNIFQFLIGIGGKVMGIAPHTLIMFPSIHGFYPFTAVCPQSAQEKDSAKQKTNGKSALCCSCFLSQTCSVLIFP